MLQPYRRPSLLSLHGHMPAGIFELKICGIAATYVVLSRSIATKRDELGVRQPSSVEHLLRCSFCTCGSPAVLALCSSFPSWEVLYTNFASVPRCIAAKERFVKALQLDCPELMDLGQ